MTDKEMLQAYLAGTSISAIAELAGLTRDALQHRITSWRNMGLKIPSVKEIKTRQINELRKVLEEFYAN